MRTLPAHHEQARPPRLRSLLAALTLALGSLPLLSAPTAHAQAVDPARVDGDTRFETAANIATLSFDQADVAHVAYAGDFPDALAASFAAGSDDGPILLAGTDDVAAPTLEALDALDVQQVVLVGGTEVLGPEVAEVFGEHGYDVARVAGETRYETAAEVASQYGARSGVGELDGQRAALLASGEDFPDALAAGPVASAHGLPLLLTPPDRTLPAVDTALQSLEIERIVAVGGSDAVSSGVVASYQDAGYEVERWGGATRSDTARTVADQAVARLGFSPELTLLARGDDFPDALAASVHGGGLAAPLLLSATPARTGAGTLDWLRAACPEVETVRAIGGTAAITQQSLADAVDAAAGCIEPQGLIDEPSGEDRGSDPFPGEGGVELTEVRAAGHDGFDRVVFEFDGEGPPGWLTETDEPPATHAGSGRDVAVAGEAYLDTAIAPAVARWADGAYDGPDRIAVDSEVVTEVVLTGDFEGHLEWAIGLEGEAEYAVGLLRDPVRLVVDVVHP